MFSRIFDPAGTPYGPPFVNEVIYFLDNWPIDISTPTPDIRADMQRRQQRYNCVDRPHFLAEKKERDVRIAIIIGCALAIISLAAGGTGFWAGATIHAHWHILGGIATALAIPILVTTAIQAYKYHKKSWESFYPPVRLDTLLKRVVQAEQDRLIEHRQGGDLCFCVEYLTDEDFTTLHRALYQEGAQRILTYYRTQWMNDREYYQEIQLDLTQRLSLDPRFLQSPDLISDILRRAGRYVTNNGELNPDQQNGITLMTRLAARGELSNISDNDYWCIMASCTPLVPSMPLPPRVLLLINTKGFWSDWRALWFLPILAGPIATTLMYNSAPLRRLKTSLAETFSPQFRDKIVEKMERHFTPIALPWNSQTVMAPSINTDTFNFPNRPIALYLWNVTRDSEALNTDAYTLARASRRFEHFFATFDPHRWRHHQNRFSVDDLPFIVEKYSRRFFMLALTFRVEFEFPQGLTEEDYYWLLKEAEWLGNEALIQEVKARLAQLHQFSFPDRPFTIRFNDGTSLEGTTHSFARCSRTLANLLLDLRSDEMICPAVLEDSYFLQTALTFKVGTELPSILNSEHYSMLLMAADFFDNVALKTTVIDYFLDHDGNFSLSCPNQQVYENLMPDFFGRAWDRDKNIYLPRFIYRTAADLPSQSA